MWEPSHSSMALVAGGCRLITALLTLILESSQSVIQKEKLTIAMFS